MDGKKNSQKGTTGKKEKGKRKKLPRHVTVMQK